MKKVTNQKDPRIAEEMRKNGVPCHSKALFFALIALAAKEEKSEILESEIHVKPTLAHKIAAKLIYDFLKRTGMRITLQIVQNEGDLHFFSQINHESANALHFRLNRPPIKKLIRMRYAKKARVTSSDDETTGWYKIESENDQTLTMEEVSSTYHIDTNAWVGKEGAAENRALSREAFSAEKFRELANGARFSKASSNKYKAYAKTEIPLEINTPFLRPASDTSSGTIQLLKTSSAPGTATTYGEEGSQRIIPTRSSSSSGRRGRRTEEDEQQNQE